MFFVTLTIFIPLSLLVAALEIPLQILLTFLVSQLNTMTYQKSSVNLNLCLFPAHCPYDFAVDFIPGATLPSSQLYQLSRSEKQAMEDYICDALATGLAHLLTRRCRVFHDIMVKNKNPRPPPLTFEPLYQGKVSQNWISATLIISCILEMGMNGKQLYTRLWATLNT